MQPESEETGVKGSCKRVKSAGSYRRERQSEEPGVKGSSRRVRGNRRERRWRKCGVLQASKEVRESYRLPRKWEEGGAGATSVKGSGKEGSKKTLTTKF